MALILGRLILNHSFSANPFIDTPTQMELLNEAVTVVSEYTQTDKVQEVDVAGQKKEVLAALKSSTKAIEKLQAAEGVREQAANTAAHKQLQKLAEAKAKCESAERESTESRPGLIICLRPAALTIETHCL